MYIIIFLVRSSKTNVYKYYYFSVLYTYFTTFLFCIHIYYFSVYFCTLGELRFPPVAVVGLPGFEGTSNFLMCVLVNGTLAIFLFLLPPSAFLFDVGGLKGGVPL